MGTRGDDYAKAQELFNSLKNENDVVATSKLHAYLLGRGMSQDWTDKALAQIDVNQDNELSWVEFGTKGIKIIHDLRLHDEEELKKAEETTPNFEVNPSEAVELIIPDEKGDIKLEAVLDENGEIEIHATQIRIEEGENGKEIVETSVEVDGEGKLAIVETKIGEEGIKVASVQQTENEVQIDVVEQTIEIVDKGDTKIKAQDEFKKQVYTEIVKEASARAEDMSRTLVLGEQPTWAGVEPCEPQPDSFLSSLLSEGIHSISSRGYAVVELPVEVTENYSNFHSAFEKFSHSSIENKKKYATQQFESSVHSPNQFHGFSVVGGLKEQFMMRLAGRETTLTTPGANLPETEDLGKVGMKLYEQLDQLCRDTAHQVAKKHSLPARNVDHLLDPVYQIGQVVERLPSNPDVCYSPYVPDGFISSSIMDNFHYYNTFEKKDQSDAKFHNNHSAHTDSGLLTVVVTTDEPGLEVFDQQKNQWIALETLIHQYTAATGKNHRRYATIFWGDSVTYLKTPALQPTLHRVGKSTKERYSVVFKQRTSTLTTPCRYQEDYILQEIQTKAMAKLKPTTQTENTSLLDYLFHPLVIGSVALLVFGIGSFLQRK